MGSDARTGDSSCIRPRLTEDLDSRLRATAAEALLARVRDFVTERTDGYPDDPHDFVREFALGVLAILDRDGSE